MQPDIVELRKNYEQLDDDKLIRHASEEASGLRPEAVDLLRQIIKERGLPDSILKSIDIQLKKISAKELTDYCNILQKLPCPICNSNKTKLNATMTGTVVSFIIMTNYQKELKIACPDCLDQQNNNAILKSALLGWWGLPWGIVKTIQSFIFNSKMKAQNRLNEANDIFQAFVMERAGSIEASKNNKEELVSIIKNIR
jgi:hypothetical protein